MIDAIVAKATEPEPGDRPWRFDTNPCGHVVLLMDEERVQLQMDAVPTSTRFIDGQTACDFRLFPRDADGDGFVDGVTAVPASVQVLSISPDFRCPIVSDLSNAAKRGLLRTVFGPMAMAMLAGGGL